MLELQTAAFPGSCSVNLTDGPGLHLDSIHIHSHKETAERTSPTQPRRENRLQHLANEHDTTLWRQHRSLTAAKGIQLELFHGDH